jgi:hypothetical protein
MLKHATAQFLFYQHANTKALNARAPNAEGGSKGCCCRHFPTLYVINCARVPTVAIHGEQRDYTCGCKCIKNTWAGIMLQGGLHGFIH